MEEERKRKKWREDRREEGLGKYSRMMEDDGSRS